MAKPPKPFEFQLTAAEADEIRNAVGQDGQQTLHRLLTAQLDNGLAVKLTDAELGKLIRYMTQYEDGGFQRRLRAAFSRSLQEQLGI